VNDLEGASGDDGVNTPVLPSTFSFIFPAIVVPVLFFSTKVLELTVEDSTASLNITEITEVDGTFVAPLTGLVLVTVGKVESVLATYSTGSLILSGSPASFGYVVKYP